MHPKYCTPDMCDYQKYMCTREFLKIPLVDHIKIIGFFGIVICVSFCVIGIAKYIDYIKSKP